jgi:erythronate-4-phosphate dehydrogenase
VPKLKIIADENIPYVNELFSEFGGVNCRPGRLLQAPDLAEADVLLVRSVTNVNAELLRQSNIDFVGTCTIGTDHCDTDYLREQRIAFASAPGCNANGVVQYVMSTLVYFDAIASSVRVGIIGCGNVGGRLHQHLKSLGFDCVCIDPFLSKEQNPDLCDFDEIYSCDVICMHTPLTRDGAFPTAHMLSQSELKKLKKDALLINAGRGGCVDNDALLQHLGRADNTLRVALDVWEHEPDINGALARTIDIATPHIAGYSFEGRVTGSFMIFEALAKHLNYTDEWIVAKLERAKNTIFGQRETIVVDSIESAVNHAYSVERDHRKLTEALDQLPRIFDLQRKYYPKRREFSHYRVQTENPVLLNTLSTLGFSCD